MVQKYKVPESREEWLIMRRMGIGGSDAGAVAGLSPYTSPFAVYCDKVGLFMEEKEDNEALRVGRDLEQYVADRFCEDSGKQVEKSDYMLQSDEYPFMVGNIDRLIVGENAFLECKTSNAYMADNFSKESIPAYHYAQICHYMAVGGFEHCYYAVLVMGIKFLWLKFTRDEMQADIDALIKIEKDFWYNHVMKGEAPDIDGSESTGKTLKGLFRETLPEEEAAISTDLLDRRAELKEQEKEIKKELDQVENEIKLEFASAELGVNESWNVSYKTQTKKGVLDTDRMIADGIDIEKYRNPGTIQRTLRASKKKKKRK